MTNQTTIESSPKEPPANPSIFKEYSENTVARIEIGTNSYEYTFIQDEVNVQVLNLKESSRGLDAELSIAYKGQPIQSHFKFNFYSATGRKSLAELLAKKYSDVLIQWDDILEYIVRDVVYQWRKPPEIIDINVDPDIQKLEYLLSPILPLGQPTTIFAPGGIGKSLFCDYLAVLLTYGIVSPLGFMPNKGLINILYIDWEADGQTHKRYIKAIKKGLIDDGVMIPEEHKQIHYLHCDRPLSSYTEFIKGLITKDKIELIIIDSQMAATSETPHGMTEAQVAGDYYNNIRSFNCTTLTIDHVTKQYMSGDSGIGTPYGSVVKYNRSRSQYELKMDDSFEDSEHKEYVFIHKKHNLTRKQKPMGFAVDFHNVMDELEYVTFSPCNIANNQELSKKSLTRKQRLVNALKKLGKASISQLAENIEEPDNERIVGITLSKSKDTFIKLGDGIYGLLANK